MLIDKDMIKKDLRLQTGFSTTTMSKLSKDENVSMDVLEKICSVLNCDVGDIMEFVPDKRPVLLTKSVPQSTRPQSPSRQEISCEYGNGCLFISFLYSEGVCSLSVTEGGEETQVYDFDSSSEAVIFVGELTSANITITTEYGHTYKGTL